MKLSPSGNGSRIGCHSPKPDPRRLLIFDVQRNRILRVLELLFVVLRALVLAGRGHQAIVLENIALRHQLKALKRAVKRPRLCNRDRLFWIVVAKTWRDWRTALVLVQPATVLRWHREWLRRRWTRRSRRNGRPVIDHTVRALIRDLGNANPLWGAPRIHGELRKLGVEVSERSVSRLVARLRPRPSQTWRTFLVNHLASTVGLDFFTVSTLTGRVLFVLVLLSHARRRVVHVNITDHPTAAWTGQQMIEAFPGDTAPRWLLRDRDRIYSEAFRRRVATMTITEVVTSPASPWQNPYVERLIGSMRRECLNHVIVFNEAHLRRLLRAYIHYYHRTRTHLGLGKDTPDHRPIEPPSLGPVVCISEVGGLHHRYQRRAA